MRITADTNILVRAITGDDPKQSALARAELENAERVAIALPALCELVWVLRRGYQIPRGDIAEALRRLMTVDNIEMNRPAAEFGLAVLEAGGDFADGVIAYEGDRLGADVFVSFDHNAVASMTARGMAARAPR